MSDLDNVAEMLGQNIKRLQALQGNKLDIVKFEDKTWQEIPDQDNPAMIYFPDQSNYGAPITKECLIIYKGTHDRFLNGGFVVAHNPKEGDITRLGVFWRLEAAELFAEAYSKVDPSKGEGNE